MIIDRNYREPELVRDEQHLVDILAQKDERGGGEFWLADELGSYPCLAIVVSGESSFVIYFPEERHAGFSLPPAGSQSSV